MAEATDFLAGLKVEEAELPARAGGRTAKVQPKDNPFVAWVGDSFSEEKGKQVKVPKRQLSEAVRLVRAAADHLGIGVRIVTEPKGEDLKKAGDAKMVTLKFQGKVRKQYKKAAKSAESVETGPAAPAVDQSQH